MPHICPRSCSRLATAAVFISVGVVQFIVGIILLRSKFVFLLAGPDFWTSTANIAVGCLLGLSANAWKRLSKHRSKKSIIRRSVLLALLFSALVINMTTLGIFLLGEGNALLSIRLENGGKNIEATFAGEVLAYAYVTSVCCPIVCIVVAIVSMSGSCFVHSSKKSSLEKKPVEIPVDSLEGVKQRSRSLRWIYTPELYDQPKTKVKELILTSSSESNSDGESENASVSEKLAHSTEDVRLVLDRMAEGKRDRILDDSAIMLRHMDLLRKTRPDSFSRDGSYVGPMLSEERHSTIHDISQRDRSVQFEDEMQMSNIRSEDDCPDFNGNVCALPVDTRMKRISFSKSKQLGTLFKNPYTSEELLNEYQTVASKLAKHYPSQYKMLRGRFKSESETKHSVSSYAPEANDNEIDNMPGVHKKSSKMPEMGTKPKELSPDYLSEEEKHDSQNLKENDIYKRYEVVEDSASPSDCFSPDGSEFDDSDSAIDIARRSQSFVGDIVPIKIKHSSALKSRKLIPVASPVVPTLPKTHEVSNNSEDSGINSLESSSIPEIINQDIKNRSNSYSSFRDEIKPRNKENGLEYSKMSLQSAKKYDLVKMGKMESISEEPNMEVGKSDNPEVKPDISGIPNDGKFSAVESERKGPARNKWQSVYTGTSNKTRIVDDPDRDLTPRKRRSASTRALKKIWSAATSENQQDFRKQVVDEDSLIGLSEEELIARQLRTRSIRKVIQQRMKEKVAVNQPVKL